jgi:hypothetical protein
MGFWIARGYSFVAEITRVFVLSGRFHVSDLRIDINPIIGRLILCRTEPKEIRPEFLPSLDAWSLHEGTNHRRTAV